MGKTKILWEYQNKPDDPNTDPTNQVTSFVVLPTCQIAEDEANFPALNLDTAGPYLKGCPSWMTPAQHMTHYQKVFRGVSSVLNETLQTLVQKHLEENPGRKVRRVALLFDEAQDLLKEEFGYEAFRFRCIRRWLMEKPTEGTFRADNNLTVVAVFSGTSPMLTNIPFHFDDANLWYLTEAGHDLDRNSHPSQYYHSGTRRHGPFWQTFTTGSSLSLLKEPWKLTEYERAVYYGRPLFALLQEEGILHDKTDVILHRMFNCSRDWTRENPIGVINVLSSRVPLGQVSVEMASDLVTNTFASLSAYNVDTRFVHLAYNPDPVPARLAMCMMDEDFSVDLDVSTHGIKYKRGMDKEWWSKELKVIFTKDLVRPDRGVAGEIFVAFYMLFCGDCLRKLFNVTVKQEKSGIQPYSQFSVSLDAWLQLMVSGGNLSDGKSPDPSNQDCKASVGFIQVCQNPLRSYNHSWKSLNDQDYLKYIYESGIGFFTCNQCEIIDMVIPIRIKSNEKGSNEEFSYVPILISIKSHLDSSDSFAPLEHMDERLKTEGISRAFCLLVVFGSNENTEPFAGEYAIQNTFKVSEDLLIGVVKKAIQVPHDDAFGLSAAFASMIPTAPSEADMYASHAFLKAYGSYPSQKLNAENALPSKSPKTLQTRHDALRTSLMTGLPGKPQD